MQVAMSDYVPDKNILRKVFLIFFFFYYHFQKMFQILPHHPGEPKAVDLRQKGAKIAKKHPVLKTCLCYECFFDHGPQYLKRGLKNIQSQLKGECLLKNTPSFFLLQITNMHVLRQKGQLFREKQPKRRKLGRTAQRQLIAPQSIFLEISPKFFMRNLHFFFVNGFDL